MVNAIVSFLEELFTFASRMLRLRNSTRMLNVLREETLFVLVVFLTGVIAIVCVNN